MAMSEERMIALVESFKGGRPLEELLKTKDQLRGGEAQRLRGHATSYSLHPAECTQFALVGALMIAKLDVLKDKFELDQLDLSDDPEEGKRLAVERWEDFRDSPNQLPAYDILQIGAFSGLVGSGSIRPEYYKTLEWMISQGISVEGTDIAGYTALQHSLTCTPLTHDFRWSQTLLDASADPIAAINHRNRYGTTAIHEAVMSYRRPGEEELRVQVLKWLLARGANMDIPDGDGSTPRSTAARFPAFLALVEESDIICQMDGGCAFCRRGGVTGKGKGRVVPTREEGEVRASLRCSRCKGVSYCSVGCQRMAWSFHKPRCKPVGK